MPNSQVRKETIDALKIDVLTQPVPDAVPVVEVGVKHCKATLIAQQALNNSAGPATLFTTPTDRDCYIQAGYISYQKDAAATTDNISLYIVTEDGIQVRLLRIACVTLNASFGAIITPFFHPIKLKRASAVTLTSSTAVGNFTVAAMVYYYIDDIT